MASMAFAGVGLPLRIAGHVASGYPSPSSLDVQLTGVSALPAVFLGHHSVPFDLAALGLSSTPAFGSTELLARTSDRGGCFQAESDGACL